VTRLPSLGRRGEGWVAGQVVLFLAVVAAGVLGPGWAPSVRGILVATGVVLGAAGLISFVAALAHLGPSLTPLPHPTDDATLRDQGLYGVVRHPIYGAGIVVALGWSLATSPLALLATVVLALFFELKSRREEAWLEERHPGYDAYRNRVRWRFIPGIR
jgi:protein-S-isoprenylcysteine O-methyltransferase Ste14